MPRHRLTNSADFESVIARGTRAISVRFTGMGLGNTLGVSRLGLVVGKRAAPRAVDRNRVKRLVRASHRDWSDRFGALDVVVQLRGNPRNRSNDLLREELEVLFGRMLEMHIRGHNPRSVQ
jgi:ribonuclease P protein component